MVPPVKYINTPFLTNRHTGRAFEITGDCDTTAGNKWIEASEWLELPDFIGKRDNQLKDQILTDCRYSRSGGKSVSIDCRIETG
jgi:hypothetical protein